MDRNPVFHEKAFDRLQAAIAAACAEVPEIDAVAVAVLWRLPRQEDVPSVMLQTADRAPPNPDTLLRIKLAVLRLEQWLIEQEARATTALRTFASELARRARSEHGTRTEPPGAPRQPPPPGTTPTDGNPLDDAP